MNAESFYIYAYFWVATATNLEWMCHEYHSEIDFIIGLCLKYYSYLILFTHFDNRPYVKIFSWDSFITKPYPFGILKPFESLWNQINICMKQSFTASQLRLAETNCTNYWTQKLIKSQLLGIK